MQRLVVDHLNSMWQKYLSPEWERTRPLLQEAVRAFEQLDYKGKTMPEIARMVLGKDLTEEQCEILFTEDRRLVFVPHPHVGPYLPKSHKGDTEMIVFFGVHLPQGAAIDSPNLSRADIVVRLNALADDNRLRILRYIADTASSAPRKSSKPSSSASPPHPATSLSSAPPAT